MKILIVTTRLPMISGKPDSFTVFKLIQFLSMKHSIVLISSYENKSELKGLKELEKLCKAVYFHHNSKFQGYLKIFFSLLSFKPFQVNYFRSRKMKSTIESVYDEFQPDILYTHLIRSAEFTRDLKCYKILAYQISHTLNYKRLIKYKKNGLIKFLYSIEYKLVKNYEQMIADYFDKILFIGEKDYQSIFKNKMHHEKLFISPHGVDLEYFSSKNLPKRNNVILFPADFSPETNKEASQWFCNFVYPIILKQLPDIRVVFAGRNPSRFLINFARTNENFIVTGYVEDIRYYFEIADVLINPVRACAGQQNKILTGMAMGLPVVSTFQANEGINAENNKQILLASGDNPNDFALKVISLFQSPALKKMIAVNGYNFVHSNWSWEKHFQDLEKNVINNHKTNG
jgi:polysaccharide biosynthesis protein PslH